MRLRASGATDRQVVEQVRPAPAELRGQSLIERDDDFVSLSLPIFSREGEAPVPVDSPIHAGAYSIS